MKVIIKNTTVSKEKNHIKLLENLIMKDKENNDLKSLEYHKLALKEHKKMLKKLRERNEER